MRLCLRLEGHYCCHSIPTFRISWGVLVIPLTPLTPSVYLQQVINARATLLGWRASAADYAQMEKPVQLCSACYTICQHLERQMVEVRITHAPR